VAWAALAEALAALAVLVAAASAEAVPMEDSEMEPSYFLKADRLFE
jgi:hypothetical protein